MDSLWKKAAEFLYNRRKDKRWRKIVTCLAAVVVFVTTYALILPAITMDDETAEQEPGVVLIQDEAATEAATVDAESAEADVSEEAIAIESEGSDEEEAIVIDSDNGADDADVADPDAEEAGVQLIDVTEDDSTEPITKTYQDDEIEITATYGTEANIPEDAEFRVTKLAVEETDEADEAVSEESEEIEAADVAEVTERYRYDIGFYVGEEEIEPENTVSLSIRFLAGQFAEAEEITAVHYLDDNDPSDTETIQPEVNEDQAGNVQAEFDMESFSVVEFQGMKTLENEPEDQVMSLDVSEDAEDTDDSSLPSGGQIVAPQITHEKYVSAENKDGTYDLSLTVSGTVGSATSQVPMDVVFIVDVSGSMDEGGRLTAAKGAANGLIETLDGNENLDVKYNVVTFSGLASTTEIYAQWKRYKIVGQNKNSSSASGWKDAYNAKSYIDNLKAKGGTNYEAGITMAIDQLKNARKGAQTLVVFLTDGEPTYRNTLIATEDKKHTITGNKETYTYYGKPDIVGRNKYYDGGFGTGFGDVNGWNLQAAVNAAGGMKANWFYAIGCGTANEDNLKKIVSAVNAPTKDTIMAQNINDLTTIFQNIAANVTVIPAKNVTVTDQLNPNVELASEDFVVTVKNKDGNVVSTPVGITASVSEDKRTITLDFPDGYGLEDGYTYIITMQIKATETAYKNYRKNNNAYPDTGGAGTGDTSAGQKGVYTNTAATVTYSVEGTEYSEEYEKPVIQLHPGKLIIQKTIEGLDDLSEEQMNALKNQLTFTVKLNDAKQDPVKLSSFTTEDNRVFTYTAAEGLSPDTSYTVTESDTEVENYTCTPTETKTSGTVPKGQTATAEFKNTYVPSKVNIKIKKIETGNTNVVLPKAEFTLYRSATDADDQSSIAEITDAKGDKITVVAVEGFGTITTDQDGLAPIANLPTGDYYLVETKAPDGYNQLEKAIRFSLSTSEIDLSDLNNNMATVEDKFTLVVSNSAGRELPHTGGSGTTLFTFGGLAILAGCLMAGYSMRRKRERRSE